MRVKNKNVFLAVGQISLALALILNRFIGETQFTSFLSGFFTGLSLVFNFMFLIMFRKEKSAVQT